MGTAPNASDLASVRDVAQLLAMLPYLEQEVAVMERALETRIFRNLNEGTLTPEAALYAWQEKASYRRLLAKFQSRIRQGQGVGVALQDQLDLDNAAISPIYLHQ